MNEEQIATSTRQARRRNPEAFFSTRIRTPEDAACIGPEAALAVEEGKAILILLANDKGVAAVNVEDWPKCSAFFWSRGTKGYAQCRTGKHGHIRLHHLVFGKPTEGFVVDHKNRFRADCRRDNLRFMPSEKNPINTNGHLASREGDYKGITRAKRRWVAQIRCDGKHENLGHFGTQERAAMAYDVRAMQLFGSMAVLNFENKRKEYEDGQISFQTIEPLLTLKCPLCDTEFTQQRHDQEACSNKCSNKISYYVRRSQGKRT